MIQQHRSPANVIRANAEALPFKDKHFDVAMAVLTVHHWSDQRRGLLEMKRVSLRQVILTFDPFMTDRLWLVRDYIPEFAELDRKYALPMERYRELLGTCTVSPVLVPWDCSDGFLAAYWRRPEHYLDPNARKAISSFSKVPAEVVSEAISRLSHDIETGAWSQRYAGLLEHEQMDFGYRLVVADNTAEQSESG
jgi:SAM-dependent methyltransferase